MFPTLIVLPPALHHTDSKQQLNLSRKKCNKNNGKNRLTNRN